jgi:hypothetical protein
MRQCLALSFQTDAANSSTGPSQGDDQLHKLK